MHVIDPGRTTTKCGLRSVPASRLGPAAIATCRTCRRLVLDLVDRVEALEKVLRTDTATGGINVRAMALRLYVRGVRVTREV